MSNLILFSLLILFLVAVQFSRGMTINRLLSLHHEAVGGAAKIKSWHSLTLHARILVQQQTGVFQAEYDRGTSVKVHVDFPGTGRATQLINPHHAQTLIERDGGVSHGELPSEASTFLVDALDCFGTFFLFKRKNASLKYLGRERMEGADCYKIGSVNPSGGISFHYLRCDNYLHICSVKRFERNGRSVDEPTVFAEFRPDASGFVLPFRISVGGMTLLADRYEIR